MPHDLQPDGKVHGVIFACRRDDGRWLMIRRSQHVAILPLKVCFPGGGVSANETKEAAVIREAREELGITITNLKPVWHHEFFDRPMILTGYFATMIPGVINPDPLEIAEVLWLSKPEALAHSDGLPTNASFLESLDGF